ncbi:unnamed protein product [Amoebophrya sp. A25]|nr:unnamed protein product [Amoebophrya sp. A25]|eukprot:GSA25T00026450001.1
MSLMKMAGEELPPPASLVEKKRRYMRWKFLLHLCRCRKKSGFVENGSRRASLLLLTRAAVCWAWAWTWSCS